jgi:plastocyanin
MRIRLLLVIIMCLGLLAACGSDSKKPSSGGSAGETVTIKDIKFSPSSLTAKVGDTITVKNDDGIEHSFTADDGSFDTGKFSSGSKTVTVDKSGSVAFHCQVHSSMKGTIQVAS